MKKMKMDVMRYVGVSALLGLAGCVSSPSTPTSAVVVESSTTMQSLKIAGLTHCNNEQSAVININPNEPLTVIVHGCFSSAGRFRTLADVYGLYNQQAVCFEYDDRKSLEETSGELVSALNQLTMQNPHQRLNIIGHSQGGLVSRRALIAERADNQMVEAEQLTLTTVSSPFNGINISSHCGIAPLRVLSLGIVDLICYAVTGEKYQQIPPNADFIQQPGDLIPSVSQHLIIKTDERNQCRKTDIKGKCVEDDYVFSIDEQSNTNVDEALHVNAVTVAAGHVEIVGNGEATPTDLIEILTQNKLLIDDSGMDEKQQAQLIHQLYH